ncbi:hypothetical protein, partial [Burkholderia pseudomallei]|uniref:hypothetical protein n=1 Tax=Burkholderia pseudomallei TaxID=28450 RepID=UPI000CCE3A21
GRGRAAATGPAVSLVGSHWACGGAGLGHLAGRRRVAAGLASDAAYCGDAPGLRRGAGRMFGPCLRPDAGPARPEGTLGAAGGAYVVTGAAGGAARRAGDDIRAARRAERPLGPRGPGVRPQARPEHPAGAAPQPRRVAAIRGVACKPGGHTPTAG